VHPQNPDLPASDSKGEPLSESSAPAGETWIDDPDPQPPALGSEVHGALQDRLDDLRAARKSGFWRRLWRLLRGT
jgi:hypothetical protein